MYDPYSFENIGWGVFRKHNQAKNLSNYGFHENKINDGKADDRVLSLIFNTQSVLMDYNDSIIVEYLWLTLDYDERMMDMVYDYIINKCKIL